MPGDEWQRFANLRLMFGYMFTHPGTKLLFMGDEFGQTHEWQHDHSLAWNLLEFEPHKGLKEVIKGLNNLYRNEPALYEKSFEGTGFEWIDTYDADSSVLVYARKGLNPADTLVVVLNMTLHQGAITELVFPQTASGAKYLILIPISFGAPANSIMAALKAKTFRIMEKLNHFR